MQACPSLTNLAHDRTVVLVVGVLCKVQLQQLVQLQRLARDRVLLVLHDIGHDVDDIIHDAVQRADWLLEGEEGDCTAVERQALEGGPALVLVACGGA